MNKIKILIAEDHLIIREGICRLLEDVKYFTIIGEAGNGEEAVRLATKLQPDIVIMDIAMPVLNGLEATRQLKLLHPTIPILILSAYWDDEYIIGLLNAGVAGYLLKTASGDELIHAINAIYKGETVLDPVIAQKVVKLFKSSNSQTIKEPAPITEKELHILILAAKGLGNQQIANKVDLSKRTVEGYMRTIFTKLEVGSRTEAVILGLKKGWFTLHELD
ncbi:MAG: response regulator transcription factor [Chloroflexi bacterium]|nr:response regulator transcription factor [Chloroflexota bacterium]